MRTMESAANLTKADGANYDSVLHQTADMDVPHAQQIDIRNGTVEKNDRSEGTYVRRMR